jgi:MoaA/NifB/PqqE/SkfB family radical SAM enzyme
MRRLTLLTNPDTCNLHCPLCFLNQRGVPSGFGEMPIEVARRSIEKYAGVREVIPSTMGEPLLYSHFEELLELCGSLGIPMNLTTNGSFPKRWGSDEGLESLLLACSDIKVSALSYETGGLPEDEWKANVEKLLDVRRLLLEGDSSQAVAAVSLQVTLHRENAGSASELLRWAERVGINRIKWNPVVFLGRASRELRERFALPEGALERLRTVLHSDKVRCEGSLYFEVRGGSCAVSGMDCDGKSSECPFADEVWVWPDSHEDHCPNPRLRWASGR